MQQPVVIIHLLTTPMPKYLGVEDSLLPSLSPRALTGNAFLSGACLFPLHLGFCAKFSWNFRWICLGGAPKSPPLWEWLQESHAQGSAGFTHLTLQVSCTRGAGRVSLPAPCSPSATTPGSSCPPGLRVVPPLPL